MKLFFLVATFSIFTSPIFSQKIPLISSGAVIKRGIELYDSGKYQDAIREFLTIPKRDTNYYYMLSELALAYTANKDNDKSIVVCQEGLKKPTEYRAHFIGCLGDAQDYKGDFESAIKTFDDGIKEFPFNYSLIFNRGVTYFNHKDYDQAIECFFKVLSINPYHAGSHLNLGLIAMRQGRKVHAMMSFGIYLSIRSTDNSRLVLLENFLSNEFADEGTITLSAPNAFDRLDQIVRAKIALDKNFKPIVPVNAALVRQYQMMFEQFQTEDTAVKDAWSAYYSPLYKAIKSNEELEPFTYHILSSADNDDVRKWIKKNDKKLQAFYNVVNTELARKRKMQTAPSLGFEQPVHAEYFDRHQLSGLGAKDTNDAKTGRWIYFYDNSQVSAEGSYEKGVKTGIWKYYFDNGVLKSVEDMRTGAIQIYAENGVIEQKFTLVNDSIQGELTNYYPCGAIQEKLNFERGKRHGSGTLLFSDGKTEATYQYNHGKLTGDYIRYFNTGVVERKTSYKDGAFDGNYLVYWANGKPRVTGVNSKGNSEGLWKYYFANGRLSHAGNYKTDLPVGEWLYYDQRGNLIEKRNFNNNGKLEGENTFYANGKKHYTKRFKNDGVIGVVHYDETGKEIGNVGNSGGTFAVKFYFPDGKLHIEGSYLKGHENGAWTYYYHSGKKQSDYQYRDGKLHGVIKEYFKTGETKSIAHYDDGELDGYYQEFYGDNSVKEEGWFQHGQRQQQWISYYPNDSIDTDYYYLNDELDGYLAEYNVDGKRYSKVIYRNGNVLDLEHYNSKGESIYTRQEKGNDILFDRKFRNGRPAEHLQFTCGNNSGTLMRWLPDGKILSEHSFSNGRRQGAYRYNEITGLPSTTGSYLDGMEQGLRKDYFSNGALHYEAFYLQNESDSIFTYYYPDGTIYSQTFYLNDQREGISKIFSPEGALLLEKLFLHDELIAYRPAKDVSLGTWTPFTGDNSIVIKYDNGITAWEEHYKNYVLEGTRRIYFSTGKLHSEHNFTKGDYHGVYSIYYANGQVLEKGNYKLNELEGAKESYSQDGSKKQVENFVLGVRTGAAISYKNGVKTSEYKFWAGTIEE